MASDPHTTPLRAARRRPNGDPLGSDDGLLEVLESARFGVQYEPIVEVASGRTIAYEALARFHRTDGALVPATQAFRWLHCAPALLVETELALKRLQLDRAPGHTVFVNLDPDSYLGAAGAAEQFIALLGQAGMDVVVEAIENLDVDDAIRAGEMIAGLRGAGVPFALDDVGAMDGLVSFESLAYADYLKFDRSLVPAPRDGRRLAVVQALVGMAQRTGARAVLEGVETAEDFELARDLGVGLVQGYLFRDRFVHVAPGGR
ncbi:EAL domain-containing protein [Anaeromyxobacter oryzae]|uniref:Diguanylate phosphodiesterase n=1 Tax=Anaeromyxobacter oryzae TaxID=2918170 RepID=A0ABM7X0U2_9BACT|nr:EAL domain-containing protein [Anaeromyxobacter oryzae]BDG05321.1 diguanylate phosphodiesterase [Anaeromyxobacter oryzae]